MTTATVNPVARIWYALASVPAFLAGPILTKELRVSSRRRRNYVLRAVYLAALTLFVLLVWLANVRWDSSRDYAARVSRMAEAGKIIIVWIAWFQFVALQIVALIMLSTSISEEVYSKTLGVLMTTPINSFQIVIGKLFSKLLQMLLLLAASLPMLALLRVLGGVPWDFVVSSLCVTLTAVLVVASVTMFFSILFRWAFVSILMSLGALAVVYLLLPLIVGLFVAAMRLHDADLIGPLMTLFANYHPVTMMGFLTVEMLEPGQMTRGAPAFFFFAWWVNCLISLGFSAIVLTACVAMVRRVGLRMVAGATGAGASDAAAIAASATPVLTPAPVLWPAPARTADSPVLQDAAGEAPAGPAFAVALPAPPPARQARVRPITGSPVIWRELRSTWIKRGVLYWVLLGVGAWILVMIYALIAWAEPRAFTHSDTHIGFVIVYTIIGMLVTAVLAATNITSEKESRSWELLLCSPLGDWHILAGKFIGALHRGLPIWILGTGHILLFTLVGCCHVALLPMYLLIAGGVVVLLAGAGLYFGSRFRRTTTAVMMNIGLGLGLWAALPGGMALLDEAFRSNFRELAAYSIDANPLFQTVVICDKLSVFPSMGGYSYSSYERAFRWEGFRNADFGETLAYLIFWASLNVVFAGFLAWRAKCQFRKRWF